MTTPTLYTDRSNAKRAAKKALGHADFEVVKTTEGKFYWIDTSPAAADAAGAENDAPTTVEPQPEEVAWESPAAAPAAVCPDMATGINLEEMAYKGSRGPGITFYTNSPEVAAAMGIDLAGGPDTTAVVVMDGDGVVDVVHSFNEPEPKADLTIDLGITDALAHLIYGLGEAAGDAIPVPKRRKGITSDAWERAEQAKLPKPLSFPASNIYAQKHADALLALGRNGDAEGLAAYVIGGTNTYAKALRDYRDALLAYLSKCNETVKENA